MLCFTDGGVRPRLVTFSVGRRQAENGDWTHGGKGREMVGRRVQFAIHFGQQHNQVISGAPVCAAESRGDPRVPGRPTTTAPARVAPSRSRLSNPHGDQIKNLDLCVPRPRYSVCSHQTCGQAYQVNCSLAPIFSFLRMNVHS